MPELNRIGIEFAVDELVIVGYGPGDVEGIDKDDVESFMDLPRYTLGMLEHVLAAGRCFGVGDVIKIAVGAVPVAVVMIIVGEAGLVGIGLIADGTQ